MFWISFGFGSAWSLHGRVSEGASQRFLGWQPADIPENGTLAGDLNATNTTVPPPPPPCNWTKDDAGMERPANCTSDPSGDVRCRIIPEFPENCTQPLLLPCFDVPNLQMTPDYYHVEGNETQHGAFRNITCAAEGAPTSGEYEVGSWGTDWYPGPSFTNTTCQNGTWTKIAHVNMAVAKPANLTCFTLEQIRKLKEMLHYLNYTEGTLNETIARNYKWIDATAILRNDTLVHAQTNAKRLYKEAKAGNMASAEDFGKVIDAMIENNMEPRGVPFSQQSCTHVESQFLHELEVPPGGRHPANTFGNQVVLKKPVRFKCHYTIQKTSTAWDYVNSKALFFYRDGCHCESDWTGGCPWQTAASPNYQVFGFSGMDQKIVTKALGSPQPNALCWYWSNPTHPEWGFLPADTFSFQAPLLNGTDLLRATTKSG